MVGGTIMAHGDDKGLRLPPAVAPVQVVIVPIYRSDEERGEVIAVATKVRDALAGNWVKVRLDDRDQYRPGYKFSEWELKGVPLRIEIGPKDVEADQVVVANRVTGSKDARSTADAVTGVAAELDAIQASLLHEARAFLDDNTHDIEDYDSFKAGIEEHLGFWKGVWCGDYACEQKVKEDTAATIRVLPLDPEDPEAPCTVCGKPGSERAIWARAY
jgi:prolyl-tRNA synthetase